MKILPHILQPALNNSLTKRACFLAVSAIAVCSVSTSIYAAEPFPLNLQQLDSISGGNAAQLAASVQGSANALGSSLVITGVKTNASGESEIQGDYRIDTVYASGVSYACCNGGTTSLDVDVSSNADTQVGFVRVYSIESSLISAKIGGGGIIGITRL